MSGFALTTLQRRAAAEGLVVSGADEAAAADRAARVVWSAVTEPGDGVAGAVIREWGPAAAYDRLLGGGAHPGDVGGVTARALGEALDRWRPRLGERLLADALRGAGAAGATLLTPDDENWPEALDDLGDHAPLCLWVRGRLPSPVRPRVAMVGARASTGYGDHVAGELSAGVVAAGVAVVSGAAYGIDGAAHRAALATGGVTVAFLAGGCDRLYPRGHADLLERIVRRGAVVSEVPCGAAPTKWRFLARNPSRVRRRVSRCPSIGV